MFESNLWIEKYRSVSLSDIPVRSDTIENLEGFLERGSLPHMIFTGPSGSGKTMAMLAVAKKLLSDGYDQHFLKVSCSDRGVMVRRKLLPGEEGGEIQKAKRRKRSSGAGKRLRLRKEVLNHVQSPPMGEVPHKILYLLDFDNEDSQTQNALRRPMETYSDNCRFVLSVGSVGNIIEPLLSRCTVIRFGRPPNEKIRDILERIEKSENVELTESGFNAIMDVTEGDIAHVINLFQAASSKKEKVDGQTVYETSEASGFGDVNEMVVRAFRGNFQDARKKLLEILIEKGIEQKDLISQIQELVLNLNAPEPVKIKLVEKMGNYDFKLVQGANGRIQLENILAHIARIGERLRN